MPLALKSRAVSFAFGVGSFFLADGSTIVRVDVSNDLLARLAGSEPPSKAGLMDHAGAAPGASSRKSRPPSTTRANIAPRSTCWSCASTPHDVL